MHLAGQVILGSAANLNAWTLPAAAGGSSWRQTALELCLLASPGTAPGGGKSPLQRGGALSDPQQARCVELLLEKGARPDARPAGLPGCRSLLHMAITRGMEEEAELLLGAAASCEPPCDPELVEDARWLALALFGQPLLSGRLQQLSSALDDAALEAKDAARRTQAGLSGLPTPMAMAPAARAPHQTPQCSPHKRAAEQEAGGSARGGKRQRLDLCQQ